MHGAKNLNHLNELLPRLKVYTAGEGLRALLSYNGQTFETDVNEKLFNAAETDYHKAVVGKLISMLGGEDLGKDDPWELSWGRLKKGEKKEVETARLEVYETETKLDDDAVQELRDDMTDEILSGTARDVASYVKKINGVDELEDLKLKELDDKNRKTVIDAINERLETLSERTES